MSGYEVVLRRKACFMWFPIRFSTYEIVKKRRRFRINY